VRGSIPMFKVICTIQSRRYLSIILYNNTSIFGHTNIGTLISRHFTNISYYATARYFVWYIFSGFKSSLYTVMGDCVCVCVYVFVYMYVHEDLWAAKCNIYYIIQPSSSYTAAESSTSIGRLSWAAFTNYVLLAPL